METDLLPPIGAFIESSLIEWPGSISVCLALQGCNLKCPYCHSAPLVPVKGGEAVDFDLVLAHLEKRDGWIDGVVVSGGEPCLHKELSELLAAIKELGLAVKLDTNGTLPDRLEELIEAELVDYIAMDVKAPLDAQKYAKAAGVAVDVEKVRQSIDMAMKFRGGSEFRTTLCPAVLTPEDVLELASELAGADRWFLQQFRPMGCLDPALLDVEPWSLSDVTELAAKCREKAPGCFVRGDQWPEGRIAAGAQA